MKITKIQDISSQKGFKINDSFWVAYEGNSQFDANNQDYLDCLAWIAKGNTVEPEFSNEKILEMAKATKIVELRTLRNEFVVQPITGIKAFEVIVNGSDTLTNNKKDFIFNCKAVGISSMEPDVILARAEKRILPNYVRYSCAIIENNAMRLGYVALDSEAASQISIISETRTTNAVVKANKISAQIQAAKTLAEVNAIEISFS